MAVTARAPIDTHLGRDPAGSLLVEQVAARELAERFGTPLHVISETRLLANLGRIRDAFASQWAPGVDVYFANKSNPSLAVRRVLANAGAGGDCNGLHELRAALIGGTPPGRMVLNGNNKEDEAIAVAVQLGIHVNIDDLDEIARVAAHAECVGRTATVGLRVKPDLAPFGERRSEMFDITVQAYRDMTKWGLEPDAAEDAVRRIAARPELELTAVHCHFGRHLADPAMFELVSPGLAALIGRLRDATGFVPRSVAIGGGFTQGRDPFFRKPAPGGPWPRPSDVFVEPIETIAGRFCQSFAAELDTRGLPHPTLRIEPGRFVTASAGVTLTRVGTVKRGSQRTWVMVDAAVTQIGMSRSPRDAHAIVTVDEPAGEERICDVVGPLCVPDLIMDQGPLTEVAPGALLAILDTGSYADGEASNANALGRPAVVLVCGAGAELVRRRETFADVFARDEIPPRLLVEPGATPWHGA